MEIQTATRAGIDATQTATTAGAQATQAAAQAGTWSTMLAGSAGLIIGMFLALAIEARSKRRCRGVFRVRRAFPPFGCQTVRVVGSGH
jgi:hypothetical protein